MFPLFYLYRNPEPILEVFFHLMKWVRFAGEWSAMASAGSHPFAFAQAALSYMMTLITEGQWPC